MNNYLLDIQSVTKKFGNYTALNEVSISVKNNVIFGLLGPNGAGKTTLIRIINQITAPDSGKVLLDGRPLRSEDISNVGYLPEERGLYKKMKVGEQAMYFAQLKGLDKQTALKELKFWFEKFEIQSWWNKKIEELSKGMQQKIQFITTVVHKPKLLIFDEPFSGFDPINANLLKEEILNLKKQGATVIFSTHNMASVEEICDDIALINKANKILEGSLVDIKRDFFNDEYEVVVPFSQNIEIELAHPDFKIIANEQKGKFSSLVFKIPPATDPNELLLFIIKHTSIHEFKEIIPSMNDVFITTVNKNLKG